MKAAEAPSQKAAALPSVVPEHEREAHMQQVAGRLAGMAVGAANRAAQVDRRAPMEQRARLLNRAITAKTVAQRIHWLRREADVVLAAAAGAVACRKGCAHCCHVATLVSQPEAHALGKAAGITPTPPPPERSLRAGSMLKGAAELHAMTAVRDQLSARFVGVPCPFLVDGACSVYEERPMACRHLINFDVDDLLCRLVPGQTISVPYGDARTQQIAYLQAIGPNVVIADIRDWFPRPAG